MGVELTGYYEMPNVPRWLGLVAYEVWIMLPADHQEEAERYLRRLTKADPAAISDEVSLSLNDQFIIQTLRSAEPLCVNHADAAKLLSRACRLLAGNPDGDDIDVVKFEACKLNNSDEEEPIRILGDVIYRALGEDSYAASTSWKELEDAFGRPMYQEEDGAYRRDLNTLRGLAARVFATIKEGHSRMQSAVKAAA